MNRKVHLAYLNSMFRLFRVINLVCGDMFHFDGKDVMKNWE